MTYVELGVSYANGNHIIVVDVNAENNRMLRFLEKHQAVSVKNWRTPKDTRMVRMDIS